MENRICQIWKENFIEDEIHFVNAVLIIWLENFFSKFNAYFNINEMDAYDQFHNILKLENIKLLVDYVNEFWNTRKSRLFLCKGKSVYNLLIIGPRGLGW